MELQGFPFLNQLTEFTTDGRTSEDAQFLCVPTSIAAGIMYLTGKHLSPDAMKDEVYSEGWVDMGTAAPAFVNIADRNGVKLYSRSGDCVAIAHEELAHNHPVVFTQQDDYAPGHPDWTHVCVWYADAPGRLIAMDPYGARKLDYDDATWRNRLRSNEVWVMARKDEEMAIDINSPGVKTFFKETDASHWQCTNGKVVSFGILGFYKRSNGLLMFGLPLTSELYPKPGTAVQVFERGIIAYDPGKVLDSPPGAGDCYPMHIDKGFAFDTLTKPLNDKIAALDQQLASTQNADKAQLIAQNQALAAQVTTYANNMKAINAKAAPFEPKP